MAPHVVVLDRGWKDIKKRIRDLDGKGVAVGIRARDAGKQGPDGTDVIDYAIYNEFGTETIPARPFMRRTAATAEAEVRKVAGRWAGMVVAGRMTVAQALGSLGEFYMAKIQGTIRSATGWAAPLSPRTIKAKGSTKPLIDHGVLINTVGWERRDER